MQWRNLPKQELVEFLNREQPGLGDELLRRAQTTEEAGTAAELLQRKDEPALRYDAGKIRYDLIPPEALEALAHVYTKGAEKYSDRNWEKGMSWGRCFRSLMSHAWKWWAGEALDEETGCHHLAMAAWNCFALYVYEQRRIGIDDRVRTK